MQTCLTVHAIARRSDTRPPPTIASADPPWLYPSERLYHGIDPDDVSVEEMDDESNGYGSDDAAIDGGI